MVRRQPPNNERKNERKTTTRKPHTVSIIEGEVIEEAKQALEEASSQADTNGTALPQDVIAEPWDDVPTEEAPVTEDSGSVDSGSVDSGSVDFDLEAKVTDLKNLLEQSQQKEQSLQQQIDELQFQLDEQKLLAQKLQPNLEKATKIQSELDQAQKTALQLAESNQKLIDENKALKAVQTQAESSKKAAQLTTLKPEPTEQDKKAAQLTVKPELSEHDRFLRQQAANLAHPVFPNDPMPNRLSEQDIGWFD